jgi:hypothetical protein
MPTWPFPSLQFSTSDCIIMIIAVAFVAIVAFVAFVARIITFIALLLHFQI